MSEQNSEVPDYLMELPAEEQDSITDEDWTVNQAEFIVSDEQKRAVSENLNVYLGAIGMTVEMIDPYCGPILAENVGNIADKWSKVIAHYPAACRFFLSEGSGTVMDYVSALRATWPVLYAIYEHHLSGTVRVIDGRPYRIVKGELPPAEAPEFPAESSDN